MPSCSESQALPQPGEARPPGCSAQLSSGTPPASRACHSVSSLIYAFGADSCQGEAAETQATRLYFACVTLGRQNNFCKNGPLYSLWKPKERRKAQGGKNGLSFLQACCKCFWLR